MKIDIHKVQSYDDERVDFHVVEITKDIQSAIDLLDQNKKTIPVISGQETIMCPTDKIYYIESVDKRTYVYTKDACYETKYRLYELETVLDGNFFRCAKAMIIHLKKINSVKADLNGRMTAKLLNGEQIVISRAYVKELKRKLGL